MTDKKLTDAEVKKALECCILGDCQGCFYGDTDQRHCKDDLMQNALDLINRTKANEKHYRRKVQNQKEELKRLNEVVNRQQAEIKHLDIESDILRADVENLNRINDELNAENESLKAEVERLNNNISAMATTLSTSARATRHEAYTEFAERLKEKLEHFCLEKENFVSENQIDNLLNELGDENSAYIDKQN